LFDIHSNLAKGIEWTHSEALLGKLLQIGAGRRLLSTLRVDT
jgi:hypothetical protein